MAQDNKPINNKPSKAQDSWQKQQNQGIRGNQNNRPLPNEVENPNRRPGQFEDPEADH